MKPNLIDRDGDTWIWVDGERYAYGPGGVIPAKRSDIEEVWGPLQEEGTTVFKLPEIPAEVTALRDATNPEGLIYVRNENGEWENDYSSYSLSELLGNYPDGIVPVTRGDLYQQAIRYFLDHDIDSITYSSAAYRHAEVIIEHVLDKEAK